MSKENYLSFEEQFKEVLNQEQISRIKDDKLRKIREKYLHMQHEAFINERDIPDWDLERVSNNILKAEQKEIEDYKKMLLEKDI